MRIIKIGKVLPTKIELYDTCKEMPVTRYNELQKLMLIDVGIGSTVEDFNLRFSKLQSYVEAEKKDESLNEMANLFRSFYLMINDTSMWSYSFLCFVKSVDGKEYNIDEDRLKEDILMLSKKGLTVEHCETQISELKKKLMTNWNHSFLTVIMDMEMQTYYQSLKESL
jgi:hypothetical protein